MCQIVLANIMSEEIQWNFIRIIIRRPGHCEMLGVETFSLKGLTHSSLDILIPLWSKFSRQFGFLLENYRWLQDAKLTILLSFFFPGSGGVGTFITCLEVMRFHEDLHNNHPVRIAEYTVMFHPMKWEGIYCFQYWREKWLEIFGMRTILVLLLSESPILFVPSYIRTMVPSFLWWMVWCGY